MAIPTSATSVALIDRLYNSGSGIVLHPETELKVVSMTTDQYISKSVNSLYLDTANLWTSAIGPTVAASYCPLEAVVDGTTQYADMYVNGGSATQTELPGSTGYGTLVVPVSTVLTIRPVGTATNNGVPTELAAAVALAGKENVVIGGSCVVISRDAANTTINVDATTTIRAAATAEDTKVPTEKAVRTALIALDTIASSYANNAEGRANTFTTNKDIAVSSWVINSYTVKPPAGDSYILSSFVNGNFVKKTDSATVNSSGIVKLHAEVTGQTNYPYLLPTEAAIKDYVDNHGGNGKPVSSATNGAVYVNDLNTSYTISAQVKAPIHIPTTGQSAGFICVRSATADSLGVVSAPLSSGLIISNGGLILASATSNTIGGVQIPSNRGLTLGDSGALTLSKAPVTPTFGSASNYVSASAYGGVVIMTGNLGAAAGNWTDLEQDAPVVPNVSAMKQYTSANFIGSQYVSENFVSKTDYATKSSAGIMQVGDGLVVSGNGIVAVEEATNAIFRFKEGTSKNASSKTYIVENPTIYNISGQLLYHNSQIVSSSIRANTSAMWYAVVSKGATVQLARASALDSNGMYAWSSGTVSGWSLHAEADGYNVVFKSADSNAETLGRFYNMYGEGGVYSSADVDRWTCSITSTQPSITSAKIFVPLAEVITDASNNVTHLQQLQQGYIMSGVRSAAVVGLYNSAASYVTNNACGGVVVMSTIAKAGAGQSSYPVVPTVDAVASAIEAAGGGGYTVLSKGAGIDLSGASNTSYTIGLNTATTSSIGGVIVGAGLSVDSTGKISVNGEVDGAYTGPFAVTSKSGTASTTTVAVNGGYLKWLDGNIWVEGVDKNTTPAVSRWVLSSATYNATSSRWEPVDNTKLYLVGSSGAVAGQAISSPSYVATISGATVAQQNVTYTTVTTSGRHKWLNGSTEFWTPAEMPLESTPFYDTADAADSCAEVTAFTYSFVAGGVTYSKSNDMDMENMSWTDGSGGVQYTSKALPSAGDSTMFTLASRYGFATVEPDLPPAGAFYTTLAQNQGGTIVQQQYGTIWHEHWGDDYKGQFAVSRIAQASYEPTYVPGRGDYAYRMTIVTGGVVYGCDGFNVLPEQLPSGAVYTPGGVYLNPGAILYDDQIISGTTKTDGIYLPYGQTANIWLNIWYGVWPQLFFKGWQAHQLPMWQFVATTFRLEGILGNTYSIYLGWVTPNGAPQQDHRGAITIRGRWG